VVAEGTNFIKILLVGQTNQLTELKAVLSGHPQEIVLCPFKKGFHGIRPISFEILF